MQLVTREQLKVLANAKNGIVESDNAFSYNEFLNISRMLLKNETPESTYIQLRDGWIREHCPPIRYLGYGSSRLAMAIDGGKCLKVAMNESGLRQMKAEVNAFHLGSEYSCFPKLYAYDDERWFSLVTDCCAESRPIDFYKRYKISCILAVGTIFELVYNNLDFDVVERYFRECIDYPELGEIDAYENFDVRLKFLSCLKKYGKTKPEWIVMQDLAEFCAANDAIGLLEDLESEVNWGLAIRNGIKCPVVIDAGINMKYQ